MGRSHETSGKREIAKKKNEKKRVKAEKRELRQSEKGKSLEEMMAYVDENGNLSAHPPDPRKRQEVRLEDISLEASGSYGKEPLERQGTVTFFDMAKGYGFIKDDAGANSYFVHTNDLSAPVKERDRVAFEVAKGQKGMKAILVRKI